MLSPRFRFLLRLVYRMIYIHTLLFLSEVYDLFQLLCVLSSVFICFPPEVIFRPRVIGACPLTTESIVAMSSCENNNSHTIMKHKVYQVLYSWDGVRYIMTKDLRQNEVRPLDYGRRYILVPRY